MPEQLTFPPSRGVAPEVLDLFTGLGGLAAGFRDSGFKVVGVDNDDVSEAVYRLDELGEFRRADLAAEMVATDAPIVIGGPPCKPWSNVNQHRRRSAHDDHALLDKFFDHIAAMRPELFLMENVLGLKSDEVYQHRVKVLAKDGYAVEARIVRYSDYGAATSRKRLFTVGVKDSVSGAAAFFDTLSRWKAPPTTVRSAIYWARNLERGAVADHDWSRLKTIDKYVERYRTGRFGWMKLDYDKPAPSFGSIAKTYILHPESGVDGFPVRVLSVREAMSIMGFAKTFKFPEGVARARRYVMVANAVSPVVSNACAGAVKALLNAGAGQNDSERGQMMTRSRERIAE